MNIANYPSQNHWSDQLRALELQLETNTDANWLTRVRIKTLRYLISRYGDNATDVLPPVPNGSPYYATAQPKFAPGTIRDPGLIRETLNRIRERWRAQ